MTVTIIRSVIIYVFVIIAIRIMGKRQLGELSNHEFVITILISAVATVPLEENAIPLTNSLLPILVFISLEVIESTVSMKSRRFSQLLEGKPVIIIRNGVLQQKEMKELRLSMSDIIDNLRTQGIFDISEVKTAVVEANGKLSVLEKSSASTFAMPVVLDGRIIEKYFLNSNESKNKTELYIALKNTDKKDILLLTVDENGKLNLIEKEG